MRIPYEWLAEYVDIKGISVEEVSEALNLSGTENEVLSDLRDFPGVVVGEILEIEKHPNADRLNVTKTKVGKEIRQIVCGAPNIEVGQKVPVALPGAMIGEFEIKETEIRGIKSSGMLCSEQELGISEDHDGIMTLNPETKVGVSLSEAFSSGGVVIEAELTPNRADCFSVIGIAREVAASFNRRTQNLSFEKASVSSKKTIEVEVKETELCPRYISRVIEGVRVGESPEWLCRRLLEAGVRPINNVVDVTNYVMLEWGQPMHAFDLSKIGTRIVVRLAKKGEKIETLDGVSRILSEKDLVIADTKKAIGIAGVMGGANSEVSLKTQDIVLEAAVFNGTSVRKTAQSLGIRTEASNRFEKGIPLGLPEIAMERAAQLLVQISNSKDQKSKGTVKAGESNDVLSAWVWKQHLGISVKKVREFLGVKISAEEVIKILNSLGLEARKFDFKAEARKHVGKPYVWGARFKTHGDLAFDCSYLTDYIYSLIGKFVGYTSLAQFELGEPVEGELQVGDILFVNGVIEKSAVDHYFVPDGRGGYVKKTPVQGKKVGHNALYIGNGRVIHARHYEYDQKSGKWVKGKKAEVVEEPVEVFTENPEYLGARRFLSDPKDLLAIDAPWWRLDLRIEEDIYEEIARIYGYDNIPAKLPSGQLPTPVENKEIDNLNEVRLVLSGGGLYEVINYSFVSGDTLKKVGRKENLLKVSNPLSLEQEFMRPDLLASLLGTALKNQGNYDEYQVFELGKGYLSAKDGALESQKLGLVARSGQKEKSRAFYDIKGSLEQLASVLGLLDLEFEAAVIANLEKGQTAKVKNAKGELGYIGMVSQKTLERFGLKTAVAVAEIDVEALFMGRKKQVYRPISKFPQSKKDISLLFPLDISIATIEATVPKSGILKKVEILDIYSGTGQQNQLSSDSKSVTIGLTFGSDERTLSVVEISEKVEEIIKRLEKIRGKLRVG